MAILKLSKEDMLQGTIVKPGWYLVNIEKIEEKEAAKKDSTNVNVLVKITSGEFAGVKIMDMIYNTKAPGFAKNFISAMLGKPVSENEEFDISNETCQGKELDVFVINQEYQNRNQNKLKDYAPAGKFSKRTGD